MKLEERLADALGRTNPDPGFTDRVIARIDAESPLKERDRLEPWMRLAAAVLLVISAGLLTTRIVQNERRNAGERAKQELILAMSIASEKTNLVRREVFQPYSASETTKGEDNR